MALSFLMVFAATVILIRPETPLTKVQTVCVFLCECVLVKLAVVF